MKHFAVSFFLAMVVLNSAFAREMLNPADAVPEVVAAGIPVTVTKLTDPRFAALNEAEDRYYLDIQFGQLTQAQYNSLRQMYGNRNFMTYDPARSYNLLDFLPASMQAVANQTFKRLNHNLEFLSSEEYDRLLENPDADYGMDLWALRKNGIETGANCWSTTIQNLNYIYFPQANRYQLSLPGRWQADEVLKSEDNSSAVADGSERVYDALLVSMSDTMIPDSAMLQHTAIHLGKKIIFEKTDSSENDPYRIALTRDVKAKYQRLMGDQLKLQSSRYGKAELKVTTPYSESDVPTVIADILQRISISPNEISSGCETGMGGGCDYYILQVKTAEVVVNPATKRGILKAPQTLLRRFESLRAQ